MHAQSSPFMRDERTTPHTRSALTPGVGSQQICSLCGTTKPLSDFPKDHRRIGGVRAECKACRSAYVSHYSAQRRQDARAEARRIEVTRQVCVRCGTDKPVTEFVPHAHSRTGISKKCRACIQADATKENPRTKVPGYTKDSRLRRIYGLALAEYSALLAAQRGVCGVCQQPETRLVRGAIAALCVDHDHETGRIRGLLCARCNMALGLLADDAGRVAALLSYLGRKDGA